MSVREFVAALLTDGAVTLPPPAPVAEDDLAAAVDWLARFEADYRLELPGTPPPLHEAALCWAATRFYAACQFTVYRDVEAEVVARELTEPLPGEADAAAHYTVDLVFRFLPGLLKFARSAAENDPLVANLKNWAATWPLSSVGVPVERVDIDGFADHPALLALYRDRIIARGDHARLGDPRVDEAVRAALGLHVQLAPQMQRALSLSNTAGDQ